MSKETEVLDGRGALEAFFSEETPAPPQEVVETGDIQTFFEEVTPTLQPPTEEVIIPPAQESSYSTFYTNLISDLIADGDWQDVAIELEEGAEPVNISEIKDITPELFRDLKEAQNQLKKEELESKYIDINGLSETDRKLIELKKKGEDITPLLQIQAQHVHPLKGLDLDDEKVHEWLVTEKYRAKGFPEPDIQLVIKRLKDEVSLDLEAKKIIEEVDSNFDAMVQDNLNKRNAEIAKNQEEQKLFRKNISEEYKKYSFKDSLTKSLVENASKADENGLTNTDRLYFQAKEKPELFAKLNLLLTDETAFNEFFGTKIKNQITSSTVNKIIKIHPKNTGAPAGSRKQENELEAFFNQ